MCWSEAQPESDRVVVCEDTRGSHYRFSDKQNEKWPLHRWLFKGKRPGWVDSASDSAPRSLVQAARDTTDESPWFLAGAIRASIARRGEPGSGNLVLWFDTRDGSQELTQGDPPVLVTREIGAGPPLADDAAVADWAEANLSERYAVTRRRGARVLGEWDLAPKAP